MTCLDGNLHLGVSPDSNMDRRCVFCSCCCSHYKRGNRQREVGSFPPWRQEGRSLRTAHISGFCSNPPDKRVVFSHPVSPEYDDSQQLAVPCEKHTLLTVSSLSPGFVISCQHLDLEDLIGSDVALDSVKVTIWEPDLSFRMAEKESFSSAQSHQQHNSPSPAESQIRLYVYILAVHVLQIHINIWFLNNASICIITGNQKGSW